MKNILITGGASGIGKGVAMHFLRKGECVIAIGSSSQNGDTFREEARRLGAEDRAIFIQADLSLIKENRRIIEEIKARFPSFDALVFGATKHNKVYTETSEGIEASFALDYLSRFILSYGLKESLEKADRPVIMNICGSGMKGNVNWEDLQHNNSFDPQKVMMHGSRLNDLSGVAFAQNDTVGKVKYVLYNPWAVQTPGMQKDAGPLTKLMYKIIGKSVEKAVEPIAALLENPPSSALSAYREYKQLDLNLATYNPQNAKRLYETSTNFINSRFNHDK